MSTVGIIGAGAWGTALGHLIAARGGAVLLYGDDAATVAEIDERHTNERRLAGVALAPALVASSDLRAVARAARLLVLAVASPRVPDVVRQLGEVTDGRHLLVHSIGAPADLPGGGQLVSDLVQRDTSIKRVGVLAGPAQARDLAARRPCAVVAASRFDEVIAETRAGIEVPGVLRVYGSNDRVGVELASALSGALTIAMGLADGLELGAGPRAVIVCRAVAEGTRLSVAAGANERTFAGLSGLGNLLVRAEGENGSDDYYVGLGLARGRPAPRETEGMRAAAGAQKMARRLHVRTPLLDAVCAVVHQGVPVAQAAARLAETASDEE